MNDDITDMADTKSEIVEMSKLPVSIIIVGVGNHSFNRMDELDSDSEILRDHNGVCAQRDIV